MEVLESTATMFTWINAPSRLVGVGEVRSRRLPIFRDLAGSGAWTTIYTVPVGRTWINRSVIVWNAEITSLIQLAVRPAGGIRTNLIHRRPTVEDDVFILGEEWVANPGDIIEARVFDDASMILSGSLLNGPPS